MQTKHGITHGSQSTSVYFSASKQQNKLNWYIAHYLRTIKCYRVNSTKVSI